MPRIPQPATIADAPAKSQGLLEAVAKQLGSVPNLFRLVATSPQALEGYLGLSGALAKGALPAMIDVVVGANGHYVKHERGVTTMADVGKRTWAYVATYSPLAAVCLAASLATILPSATARVRRRRSTPAASPPDASRARSRYVRKCRASHAKSSS